MEDVHCTCGDPYRTTVEKEMARTTGIDIEFIHGMNDLFVDTFDRLAEAEWHGSTDEG